MTGMWNAWELVSNLRWEDHAHLAVWHLWAVLLVLSGFAGFGLHYVFGYVFRFYWRTGKFQWWIALLSFPVLMASTYALVWSYALSTGAPRLTDRLLHDAEEGQDPLTVQVGAYLLQPAFDQATVAPDQPGPTGAALAEALAALPADALRRALGAEYEPESEPVGETEEDVMDAPADEPHASEDAAPGEDPAADASDADAPVTLRPEHGPRSFGVDEVPTGPNPVVLDIVRDWITDPDQSWPDVEAAEGERPPGREPGSPLSPADFIISLIREIPPESALTIHDWSYVAGQRLDERWLAPLLAEYLETSASVIAILIVVLNVAFFWLLSRMNRPPKPAKGKAGADGKPTPADPLKAEGKAP